MKKLMFVALILAAGISFADDYSPSKVPTGATSPDVMPGVVNFQGLLRDPATGNPYKDGIYTLECRLYTALTGTKAIWGAKYQAYVREGYFNIMLGSTGTPLGGCTYQNPTDLWKALWYSGDNRELYLGVTPWQGADGQTIADADKRKEITPRQQLLAAPFALRAQKAQYADAAVTDFKVPGDLTVAGQIKNADGSAFGLKNVKAGDTTLQLGNDTTSPYETKVFGSVVSLTSGSTMAFNPGANLNVELAAGKNLAVYGNNGEVWINDASRVEVQGGEIELRWGAAGTVHSGGIAVKKDEDAIKLSAKTVLMKSTSSNVDRGLLQAGDNGFIGFGNITWGTDGGSSGRPFVLGTVTVDLPKDAYYTDVTISSKLSEARNENDYRWMIVGYEIVRSSSMSDSQWRSPELREMVISNNKWIRVRVDESISVARQFKVQLLGINAKWCNDKR